MIVKKKLSDAQVYGKLQRIAWRDGELGKLFRASHDHYFWGESPDRAKLIHPEALWLAIDDEIETLASSDRPPRLKPIEERDSNFRLLGPHGLSRMILWETIQSIANPKFQEIKREHATTAAEISRPLQKARDLISDASWPLFRARTKTLSDRFEYEFATSDSEGDIGVSELDAALKSLDCLRHIVNNERKLHKPQEGAPPQLWKYEFVSGVERLWWRLTGEGDQPVSVDTPFARFVEAAWISLDENLPEENFAGVIRNRKTRKRAARNPISLD